MDSKSLAAVRQQFAQSVFSHKIQEVACERKGKLAKKIKILQLSLTSILIFILAAQAAGYGTALVSVIGIFVGAIDLIFLIVQLNYGFEKQAADHKASALKYLSLRDRYLVLIADLMSTPGKSAELRARRNELSTAYHTISDAPDTNSEDYVVTQKRLQTNNDSGGEQYSWSDAEIDSFLPTELKSTAITA